MTKGCQNVRKQFARLNSYKDPVLPDSIAKSLNLAGLVSGLAKIAGLGLGIGLANPGLGLGIGLAKKNSRVRIPGYNPTPFNWRSTNSQNWRTSSVRKVQS